MVGDNSVGYKLDEALVAIGFGKFQLWVLAYAGLGCIGQAMEMMIVSFIGQSVKSEWNLSATEESVLTTVIFVGILIGAYSWGFISDNYGRRKGLLGMSIVTSGAGILSAFAPNYSSMLILRCLVGVGLGGGPVYSSWFLEFVPAPNRGTWMVISLTFSTVGTIMEASLAWIIMPSLGWRWLLALSSLPSFAALPFYNLIPESPRYQCMKGKIPEAENMLKRIGQVNQTKLPPGTLISDQIPEVNQTELSSWTLISDQIPMLDEEVTLTSDTVPLSMKAKEIEGSNTCFSTLWLLFTPNMIKTTFLLWMVFFGINFAYFGILLLTSELGTGESHCSSATLLSDNSQDSRYRDILVASFAELPGIVCSAFIVDRVGRKLSMVIMFILGSIFLLPLLLDQHEISATISLFGARMFITGTYTVANVYAPEIYPTFVRATGVGLANAIGGVGGMLCPLAAVVLLNGCHQTAAILLFEFVIVVSGVCVLFFPLETKGQELSDSVLVI